MVSSSLRISRWSTVELPILPPACASVILMSFFALSLMILLYNFPKLLDSVIPLSLEHLPFIPFPLYIVMISPSCPSCGIVSVFVILFRGAWYMVLVSWSASMKASFGMLSGPVFFFPFEFLYYLPKFTIFGKYDRLSVCYLPKFTIFGKYVRLSGCLSVCLLVCQFCQA